MIITTPPPWEQEATHNEADQVEVSIYAPSPLYGSRRLIAIVYGHTDEEALANARLIAAAPDMLAALEATVNNPQWALSIALNALDAARGQTT